MTSSKDSGPGSPDRFADDLYNEFSKFKALSPEEVKEACCIALNVIMREGDTTVRFYYGECKKLIKSR